MSDKEIQPIITFLGHRVGTDPRERRRNFHHMQACFRLLVDLHPERAFMVPWWLYVQTLAEDRYRERGVRDGLAMLRRCDEVWLLVDHDEIADGDERVLLSPGMLAEEAAAQAAGVLCRVTRVMLPKEDVGAREARRLGALTELFQSARAESTMRERTDAEIADLVMEFLMGEESIIGVKYGLLGQAYERLRRARSGPLPPPSDEAEEGGL